MNQIVVANDFSTCSENAVKYAQRLVKEGNQFLDSFFTPKNIHQNSDKSKVIVKDVGNLSEFDIKISQNITYNHLLILGQQLLNKLHQREYHKINEPFLVVPSEYNFKKVNKVLFLCFSSEIDKVIKKIDLNHFSEIFDGEAHIMNVYKEQETEEEKLLKFVLDYESKTKNGSILFFNDQFLLNHIQHYIQNTETNLVVLLSNPENNDIDIEKILENIKIPLLTSFILD